MCAVIMEDQELTLDEVSRRLQVSYDTALRRVRSRKIRARKEGMVWRVRESDLQKYIDGTYKEQEEKT